MIGYVGLAYGVGMLIGDPSLFRLVPTTELRNGFWVRVSFGAETVDGFSKIVQSKCRIRLWKGVRESEMFMVQTPPP